MIYIGDNFSQTLQKDEACEYKFEKPPDGKSVDCTVTQGACAFRFYEDDRLLTEYQLSTAPGEIFFIRLNTASGDAIWRIDAIGVGDEEANTFECVVVADEGYQEKDAPKPAEKDTSNKGPVST